MYDWFSPSLDFVFWKTDPDSHQHYEATGRAGSMPPHPGSTVELPLGVRVMARRPQGHECGRADLTAHLLWPWHGLEEEMSSLLMPLTT